MDKQRKRFNIDQSNDLYANEILRQTGNKGEWECKASRSWDGWIHTFGLWAQRTSSRRFSNSFGSSILCCLKVSSSSQKLFVAVQYFKVDAWSSWLMAFQLVACLNLQTWCGLLHSFSCKQNLLPRGSLRVGKSFPSLIPSFA
jgi:hypothetical protein